VEHLVIDKENIGEKHLYLGKKVAWNGNVLIEAVLQELHQQEYDQYHSGD